MTDLRLRTLERRWRESNSLEDETGFLRERLRVGDLSQERLELAAYCGHPAALQLVGKAEVAQPSLPNWFAGLRRWPCEVSIRGMVAAGQFCSGLIDRAAIVAASAWLAEPTRVRAGEVRHAIRAAREELRRATRDTRLRAIEVHLVEQAIGFAALGWAVMIRRPLVGFFEEGQAPSPERNPEAHIPGVRTAQFLIFSGAAADAA